uniref:CUB domain-containing protein n=1 Tax=Acrobeloides nanus TaxID=290746 RepID=A0A914EKZ5_9BILA
MHNFACYHGFLLFFFISLKVLNINAVCFSPDNIALSNVTNPRFTLTPSSGANGEFYEPNMTCSWKIVVPSSYETKIMANVSNRAIYSNDILRIDDCNGGNVI